LSSFFLEYMQNKVIIQGFQGSFHDIACQAFFEEQSTEVIACDSFNLLAKLLSGDTTISHAVMAIENSIAGSILQNYRLLREHNFNILGEVYLRIEHCLMALPGSKIDNISEVHSHPMAINQCRNYFSNYPSLKLVDKSDTALSAKMIQEKGLKNTGAIASKRAAEIYKLDILQANIEDNKQNYTRFFIIQKPKRSRFKFNKVSLWLQLPHIKGSLAKVLNKFVDFDINLSNLQSYPVLGQLTKYFFHMDLEIDKPEDYLACMKEVRPLCLQYEELGRYQRADLSAALRNEITSVML